MVFSFRVMECYKEYWLHCNKGNFSCGLWYILVLPMVLFYGLSLRVVVVEMGLDPLPALPVVLVNVHAFPQGFFIDPE